jgi:hypothetical protein
MKCEYCETELSERESTIMVGQGRWPHELPDETLPHSPSRCRDILASKWAKSKMSASMHAHVLVISLEWWEKLEKHAETQETARKAIETENARLRDALEAARPLVCRYIARHPEEATPAVLAAETKVLEAFRPKQVT